jgi:putative NADH-flavin reductase
LVARADLGQLVIQELQRRGAKARAIVRNPGTGEALELAKHGVEVFGVDVVAASGSELEGAMRGAYSVVSTLQGGPDVIIDAQLKLLSGHEAWAFVGSFLRTTRSTFSVCLWE